MLSNGLVNEREAKHGLGNLGNRFLNDRADRDAGDGAPTRVLTGHCARTSRAATKPPSDGASCDVGNVLGKTVKTRSPFSQQRRCPQRPTPKLEGWVRLLQVLRRQHTAGPATLYCHSTLNLVR